MRVLDRVNAALAEARGIEQRSITGVPWRPWDNPYVPFVAGGPLHPARKVQSTGQEAALRLAPVYACVRVLADGVAKLPLQQYRDTGARKVKIPAGQLLRQPSAYGTLYDWLFTGMTSLALHGNAYGLITDRDGYGYPTAIEWLPPERVTIEDVQPWNPAKATFYYWGTQVKREDLLHLRAFAIAGRTEAVSPLRSFQMLIESGQQALAYGTGWYESGGHPPGVFRNEQYEVDDELSAGVRKKLVETQQKRVPLVIGRDWTYTPIAVKPDEAQFIQAQQLTATQIAAIYGVQPRKAGGIHGDSQTYSNQSYDQIAEITDTLDPWLVRFEAALGRCIPQQQYVQFNRDARIRNDIQTRYTAYRTARDIGMFNVDEIRELEDREPIPKPSDPTDYDGTDYTPLQIQVAAARGIKELVGEGTSGAAETNPQAAPKPAMPSQQQVPAGQPAKVPAANGHGKPRGG